MTLKQRLLFTLLMCIGMGSVMSWLGMATSEGLGPSMWQTFWPSVVPTIAFAFIFNLLVASNLSNWLIKWRTKGLTDPAAKELKAGTIRGWTMILTMCLTMSTRGVLQSGALFHMTFAQFLLEFFESLAMAYFVRDLFIKPLVRRLVFRWLPAA